MSTIIKIQGQVIPAKHIVDVYEKTSKLKTDDDVECGEATFVVIERSVGKPVRVQTTLAEFAKTFKKIVPDHLELQGHLVPAEHIVGVSEMTKKLKTEDGDDMGEATFVVVERSHGKKLNLRMTVKEFVAQLAKLKGVTVVDLDEEEEAAK